MHTVLSFNLYKESQENTCVTGEGTKVIQGMWLEGRWAGGLTLLQAETETPRFIDKRVAEVVYLILCFLDEVDLLKLFMSGLSSPLSSASGLLVSRMNSA